MFIDFNAAMIFWISGNVCYLLKGTKATKRIDERFVPFAPFVGRRKVMPHLLMIDA